MGSSTESSSSFSSLLNPSLLLALGGLIVHLASDPQLQSRRPDSGSRDSVPAPPYPAEMHSLHSRLWDDPLAVAHEHSQRKAADKRNQSGLLGALFGDAGSDGQAHSDVQTYLKHVVEEQNDKPLLCLPILVPGEPYDADTEKRKRITYAVLSALGNCDYKLRLPDRLSYIELPVWVDTGILRKPVKIERLVVPIKLFDRIATESDADGNNSKASDRVIVCWINEEQLGSRPLALIGQVLEGMFGKVENRGKYVALKIVGPTDSDTLLEMAEESSKWTTPAKKLTDDGLLELGNGYRKVTSPHYFCRNYSDPTMYAARPTIDATAAPDTPAEKSPKALHDFTLGNTTPSGLRVVRTIGTDRQLACKIRNELSLRDAWPSRSDTAGMADPKKRFLVLVTEQDTPYGIAVSNVFKGMLGGCGYEPLQVFTYLRGLDGKVPGEKNKESGDSNSLVDQRKPAGDQDSSIDPFRAKDADAISAIGRSQFDYLRRLQAKLSEFDDDQRSKGEGGITAIGVVGTDIFDKLLILRALRKRFPNALFFMTDLDASISLPSEYATTRNVLVASHFGLELHPDLQRRALPFRDSYQSSTYFSCLLALGDASAHARLDAAGELDPWGTQGEPPRNANPFSPLVFEVGRRGPYQLTLATSATDVKGMLHPPGPRSRHWLKDHLCKLLIILIAAGLSVSVGPLRMRVFSAIRRLFHLLNPWDFTHDEADSTSAKIFVMGALAVAIPVIVVVAIAVNDHFQPTGEPFVLFGGISIWTATLIRLMAAGLGILLFLKGWMDFRACCLSEAPDLLNRCCDIKRMSLGCAVVFITLVGLLVWMDGESRAPYRGTTSNRVAYCSLLLVVCVQTFLTFFVANSLFQCRKYVRHGAELAPGGTVRRVWTGWPGPDPVFWEDRQELETVGRYARLTKSIGRMVKYPYIVLLLVILSRHPSIDIFDCPWWLLGVWTTLALAVAANAYGLRQSAAVAREIVLSRLRESLLAELRVPPFMAGRADQLRQNIAEIESMHEGAFAPWTQDPLFKAMTFLGGGVGGIRLLEELLPYV